MDRGAWRATPTECEETDLAEQLNTHRNRRLCSTLVTLSGFLYVSARGAPGLSLPPVLLEVQQIFSHGFVFLHPSLLTGLTLINT